jgi:XTP/dITP diphosphohydrolase
LKLLCATANQHKLKEIRAIMAGLQIQLHSLHDFPDLMLPAEDGATYAENALLKAKAAFRATGECSFADDTGLEVEALHGAPGLLSHRFAADDAARREKLLQALQGIPSEKRGARFVCIVAFAWPGGERTFSGVVKGEIALAKRGDGGFGYDPLFLIPEVGRTFGEMGELEKNQRSHRAKALLAFSQWLKAEGLLGSA